MIEILKIASLVLVAAGIILIGLSVYFYIKKDIRTLELDLKTTRKVSSENKYDNALTNSIYYKAEAEYTPRQNKPPVQPRGFRREQERPARNDTGLLRDNVQMQRSQQQNTSPLQYDSAENSRSTAPLQQNLIRPGQNTAPLHPREKNQRQSTAPLSSGNHNTLPLNENDQRESNRNRLTLPLE